MPRKGENIYKRKDGRWEGRYIKAKLPNRKTQYGYVYAKSYRETKIKLAQAMLSKDSIDRRENCTNTFLFEDVAWEWFYEIRPNIKESTENKYWSALNRHILPEIGKIPLNNLTCDQLNRFSNRLLHSGGAKKTGLAPKTVSDILSVVRNIQHFSNKRGYSFPGDAGLVRIRQAPKEMRVLSQSEQDQLCRYLYDHPDPYHLGILVCLFTGLRVGELCALRWEDISLLDQTIHVHQTMQRIQDRMGTDTKTKIIVSTPKSACSIRTIPMSETLVEIISAHKTSETGYFLTNNDHKFVEPRTMQNRFKRALKQCNVESANFHALRHTFATRCIELGFDVKSLSEILGHASIHITMDRYVHPSMELKKQNMQKLSALLAVK